MNAKNVLERLQAILNGFLGFEAGVGYTNNHGPSSDVRIARAVYSIEGLMRELSTEVDTQEPSPEGAAAGSSS